MNSLLNKLLPLRGIEYLTLDRDLKILKTSLGVQRFADRPDEAIPGKDVRLAFPELIGVEDLLIEVLEGKQVSFDLKAIGRFLDPNHPLYFNIYIIQNTEEENLVKNLIFFLEDATERRVLEQSLVQSSNETNLLLSALSASKTYVDKILTSMSEVLIVTTSSGIIKTINKATQSLFGYTEADLIARPISLIVPEDEVIFKVIQPAALFPQEDFLNKAEVVGKTKTGKKVYIAFSCSAIQTDLENLQDFVYIGRDITESKRAQQRQLAQYCTTRILSESLNLKQVGQKLLPALCESLGWDVGEIWMPSEASGAEESNLSPLVDTRAPVLRCMEFWHRVSVPRSEFTALSRQVTFAPGVGLPGRVWSSATPQWVTDVVDDANFARSQLAAKEGLHAGFGFPIQGDNEVLGVITFYTHEVQLRDEDLLQTMAAIGSQIGQFIQRKRTEAALKESELRFRQMAENIFEVFWMSDPNKNQMIYVSPAYEAIWGRSREELYASPTSFLDTIYPEDRDRVISALAKQIQGNYDEEYRIVQPNASIRWIRDRAFPIYNERGIVYRLVGIAEDITDRKYAEYALRESEEQYRDLFENASDLIQSVAADGRFLYVNRAWRETLGYSEAEIAQMTVFDIIHPQYRELCSDTFKRLMSGENSDRIKAEFITKKGNRISVEGSVSCKFVEEKLLFTRAIFRDITEQLQAEEALHHQQQQTERLLLNILPEAIADRLKQNSSTIAEDFASVSVLFADIVGFTQIAAVLSPIELVNLLNKIFSAFDRLCDRHGLEKIKTIGDAYMVVGGLPMRRENHAEAIAEMALDMQRAIAEFNAENNLAFSIRIGIHSGPVVAGVIGIKKFIYDLWGDTVNIASRMESHGSAGKIHVSDATYKLLKEQYFFEKRGGIQVKGKGEMITYFLLRRKVQGLADSPNTRGKDPIQSRREATQRIIEQLNDKLRDI